LHQVQGKRITIQKQEANMNESIRKTGVRRLLPVLLMLVGAAVMAAGCAGSQTQQSTGEFVDDTVLSTKVKTALVQDDEVDALDIKVKTFKRVVQLSGFADSESERQRAESIAARVDGVERVQNDVRIK
jgi:hyperosmotically inducible periplasmic protein